MRTVPPHRTVYSNIHYGEEFNHDWHASQRICAPDYFDRYLFYGIPTGGLADVDLRSFLEHFHEQSEEEATTALGTLFDRSSAKGAMEKLRPFEAVLALLSNILEFLWTIRVYLPERHTYRFETRVLRPILGDTKVSYHLLTRRTRQPLSE